MDAVVASPFFPGFSAARSMSKLTGNKELQRPSKHIFSLAQMKMVFVIPQKFYTHSTFVSRLTVDLLFWTFKRVAHSRGIWLKYSDFWALKKGEELENVGYSGRFHLPDPFESIYDMINKYFKRNI